MSKPLNIFALIKSPPTLLCNDLVKKKNIKLSKSKEDQKQKKKISKIVWHWIQNMTNN